MSKVLLGGRYKVHSSFWFTLEFNRLSVRLVFCFMIAALIGCESRPPAVSKIIELKSIDRNIDVWSTSRVLLEYRQVYQDAIDERESFCESIESVSDRASLEALLQQVEEAAREQRRHNATADGVDFVYLKLDDIEFKRFQLQLKEANEPFLKQLKLLGVRKQEAVEKVVDMLKQNSPAFTGLRRSAGLTAVFGPQSLLLATGLSTLVADLPQVIRIYPDNLRVTVVVPQVDGNSAVNDYLKEKTKAERVVSERVDEYYRIELSPIGDFSNFCASIDIGEIQNKDESHRIVELKLDEADRQKLAMVRDQQRDTQRQEAKEKQALAAQEKAAREESQTADARNRLATKQAECNAKLSDCLDRLKRINSHLSCLDEIKVLKSLCYDFQRAKSDIERASKEVSRITGELPTDLDAGEDEWLQKIDVEIARLVQDVRIRAVLSGEFGRDLDAKQLLFDKVPSGGYSNPAEDPKHPDYLAANLVDLSTTSYSRVRDALHRFTNIEPTSVDDPQLRKDIARAIRDVAINGSSSYQADAIEPLSVWAGRYCVPVLGEILENNPSRSIVDKIFETLCLYPSNESAKIACEQVGHYSMNDAACKALLKMGPVAESAVLKIAPTNDPKVCLLAVQILSEIGTRDSLNLLREAKSSTNADVRQASAYASKQILFRTNTAEKGDE